MRVRRKSAATISDIGRDLGLSAMTVSRALNGHPDVNEETRRRVLLHAEQLRYRPNRWARSLVTQRSRILGMIVPDISHSFFSEITRSFQETIEQHGYDLMLCHTHSDPVRELAAIDMLLGSRADGLVVASVRPENDPGVFAELRRDGMPFVLLDRFFPGLDCGRVRTDDFEVGRLAGEHLIDLGHHRIAHIRGPTVSVGRLRWEGFQSALRTRGIAIREEWVVDSNFAEEGGYQAMSVLLTAPERPSAVFAVNDPSAVGAIRACREFGLHVPEDVSIVGAGSIERSLHESPFLTTIDWSCAEMGERAADMLLNAISAGTGATTGEWKVRPSLTAQQSSASPVRIQVPAAATV